MRHAGGGRSCAGCAGAAGRSSWRYFCSGRGCAGALWTTDRHVEATRPARRATTPRRVGSIHAHRSTGPTAAAGESDREATPGSSLHAAAPVAGSLQSRPYAGLRRHRHRRRSQRSDRGRGHGAGRPASPLPGEEPLHRRDGLDDRADPRLPLRAGRLDPVPGPERDLRGPRPRVVPHLRARGPVGEHQRRRPAADLPLLGSGAAARAPRRDARASRRCWAWPRWRHGPRHQPGPSAASTCANPRSHSTRCGPAPANEAEREAIRTAMFGSVMDVVDRYLPGQGEARTGAQHAELPRGQFDLPGPVLAGQRALPRLRPGLAGDGDDVEGARRARHHRRPPVPPVRAARRRAAPPRQGGAASSSRAAPSRASTSATARSRPRRSWSPTSIRPRRSPS